MVVVEVEVEGTEGGRAEEGDGGEGDVREGENLVR